MKPLNGIYEYTRTLSFSSLLSYCTEAAFLYVRPEEKGVCGDFLIRAKILSTVYLILNMTQRDRARVTLDCPRHVRSSVAFSR